MVLGTRIVPLCPPPTAPWNQFILSWRGLKTLPKLPIKMRYIFEAEFSGGLLGTGPLVKMQRRRLHPLLAQPVLGD